MRSPRRERRHWAPIIVEFEQVGGTHAAFCASRALPLATFRRWLYRLRREGSAQTSPRFVEVRAAEYSAHRETACVLAHGDAKVSFRALPAPEYLAAVLCALEHHGAV